MGSTFSYIITFGVTYIVSTFGQKLIWGNKNPDGSPKKPWPDSPKHLPFFLNGWSEYNRDGYHALTRWSKELGDLFSVKLIQKRILVIGSMDMAKKLFVELDQYNSTRMSSDLIEQEMTNHGKTVFSAGFTPYWTRLRRAIYIVIGKMYVPNFEDLFTLQSDRLCTGIDRQLVNKNTEGPENTLNAKELRQLVDMIAMDTALTLTLGRQLDPVDIITLIQLSQRIETKQTERIHRLSTFFTPLASLLQVKEHLVPSDDLHEKIVTFFQDHLPPPTTEDNKITSIAASLLHIEPSKNDPTPVQLDHADIHINLVHITLHAYTYLASALFTLIQRIATDPTLQTRILTDGFAHACVKESLRMDPPMRLISHTARVDYDTPYRVDAHTELIMNLDAIHQQFQPDGGFEHAAFGMGRRVCIAADASERLLTTILTRLVQTYALEGGDVIEKIEHSTNVWGWTGRTETKGSNILFIKREKEMIN